MLTIVTSHVRGLPPCHGISVSPSGRLPSILTRPTGSLLKGTPAAVTVIIIIIINQLQVVHLQLQFYRPLKNLAKIGPVDVQIIGLTEIVKKETAAKHKLFRTSGRANNSYKAPFRKLAFLV